jgi:hypothetical protein
MRFFFCLQHLSAGVQLKLNDFLVCLPAFCIKIKKIGILRLREEYKRREKNKKNGA